MVRVNERALAAKLGWDRGTVARGISDLQAEGHVRRMKNLGHRGLLVALLSPMAPEQRASRVAHGQGA